MVCEVLNYQSHFLVPVISLLDRMVWCLDGCSVLRVAGEGCHGLFGCVRGVLLSRKQCDLVCECTCVCVFECYIRPNPAKSGQIHPDPAFCIKTRLTWQRQCPGWWGVLLGAVGVCPGWSGCGRIGPGVRKGIWICEVLDAFGSCYQSPRQVGLVPGWVKRAPGS